MSKNKSAKSVKSNNASKGFMVLVGSRGTARPLTVEGLAVGEGFMVPWTGVRESGMSPKALCDAHKDGTVTGVRFHDLCIPSVARRNEKFAVVDSTTLVKVKITLARDGKELALIGFAPKGYKVDAAKPAFGLPRSIAIADCAEWRAGRIELHQARDLTASGSSERRNEAYGSSPHNVRKVELA